MLDLNQMLAGMEPMLRRLLGQNIELLLLTTPALGRIQADPSQIEQVIVNLATNARDAMPNGGKLVIETANVDLEGAAGERLGMKPGPCVMLAVSDNGIGMDAETRSRLFEPFFTTKEPGKGSGLGLSTVYGVIKQADGQVTVYSQPELRNDLRDLPAARARSQWSKRPRRAAGQGVGDDSAGGR